MNREKIALIGYGYWGKILFRYLNESTKFDLVYVYFPSLKNYPSALIKNKFGKEFVNSLEAIWNDKSVKNLLIATPIKTHFSVAKTALLNGKNLLVEKPLSLKTEEVLYLKGLAVKNNLKLFTEYTYTFSKALLKAKEIVEKHEIGNIKSFQISIKQLGRFLDYDVYILLGSHCLSILDMFVPVDSVCFEKVDLIKTNGIVTSGLINVESEKLNITGSIDISLNCPQREKKVIIYFEKGTLIYNPLSSASLKVVRYKNDKSLTEKDLVIDEKEYFFNEKDNLQFAIDTFYNVLNGIMSDNLTSSIAITKILEELSSID